jgi:hypothetical protein
MRCLGYIFGVRYKTLWDLALLLSSGNFLYTDTCISVFMFSAVRSSTECKSNRQYDADNKVRELTTACVSWQQWIETSVWFDDVGIPSLLFGSTEMAA